VDARVEVRGKETAQQEAMMKLGQPTLGVCRFIATLPQPRLPIAGHLLQAEAVTGSGRIILRWRAMRLLALNGEIHQPRRAPAFVTRPFLLDEPKKIAGVRA
jgi:hypothetical protein